jgi:hypothetical protein
LPRRKRPRGWATRVLLDRGDFLSPRRAPHKFTPRDVRGPSRPGQHGTAPGEMSGRAPPPRAPPGSQEWSSRIARRPIASMCAGRSYHASRRPGRSCRRGSPGRGNARPLGRVASGEGGIDVLPALAGVAEHSLRCPWSSPRRQRARPAQLRAGIVLLPGDRRHTTKVPLAGALQGALVCRQSLQCADALDRRGAGQERVECANRARHAVGGR